MTEMLEKAFAEAAKLNPAEQEALAAWILEELAAEKRWQAAFQRSAKELGKLADDAVAEHRENRTQRLDPGSM